MTKQRTHGRVLIDLLRSTNGGPVSTEIIRGVLWPERCIEPVDWVDSVRHLAYTTRRRHGTVIKMITRTGFVGYQLVDAV